MKATKTVVAMLALIGFLALSTSCTDSFEEDTAFYEDETAVDYTTVKRP